MTLRLLVVLPLAALLAGCGGTEHEDLKEWMREQAQGLKGKPPAIPKVVELPPVSYQSDALLPPFSPAKIVTVEAVADKSAPDRDRPRQPLESFALEDLRVTGTIIDRRMPVALVQPPPPNKPKYVTVGEFMGQNFGRVVSITHCRVVIVETVKDNNGAWMERDVVKDLSKQGGKECEN